MEVVFENPNYLWALIVVPIVILAHFVSLRYSRARALKFANFIALSRVVKGVGMTSNITVLTLRVLTLTMITLAIAGTTLIYFGDNVNVDYVLAIDSSSSMLAEDLEPSRIEAARHASKLFVESLPSGSSVGVVSFAGTSFVEQGLTDNKDLVIDAIDNIRPLTVGGTDIGGAIITSTNLLISSPKARSVILLTDGRSNVGVPQPISINYANDNIVLLHTVGVGTLEGYDEFLGVDEKTLTNLAELTGGSYFFAEDSERLDRIYEEFASSAPGKKFINFSSIFIFLSLLLLLTDWVLINTVYSRIP